MHVNQLEAGTLRRGHTCTGFACRVDSFSGCRGTATNCRTAIDYMSCEACLLLFSTVSTLRPHPFVEQMGVAKYSKSTVHRMDFVETQSSSCCAALGMLFPLDDPRRQLGLPLRGCSSWGWRALPWQNSGVSTKIQKLAAHVRGCSYRPRTGCFHLVSLGFMGTL